MKACSSTCLQLHSPMPQLTRKPPKRRSTFLPDPSAGWPYTQDMLSHVRHLELHDDGLVSRYAWRYPSFSIVCQRGLASAPNYQDLAIVFLDGAGHCLNHLKNVSIFQVCVALAGLCLDLLGVASNGGVRTAARERALVQSHRIGRKLVHHASSLLVVLGLALDLAALASSLERSDMVSRTRSTRSCRLGPCPYRFLCPCPCPCRPCLSASMRPPPLGLG